MKHAYREAEQRCEHDRTDEHGEAASLRKRIEQLERELAKWRPLHPNPADARYWEGRFRDADTELAAEKALADRLHFALTNAESADINAVLAAYRKARGL